MVVLYLFSLSFSKKWAVSIGSVGLALLHKNESEVVQ